MLYIIVKDGFLGFSVRARPRWWPFYLELNGSADKNRTYGHNSFVTVEDATKFAAAHADNLSRKIARHKEVGTVVLDLGNLNKEI